MQLEIQKYLFYIQSSINSINEFFGDKHKLIVYGVEEITSEVEQVRNTRIR